MQINYSVSVEHPSEHRAEFSLELREIGAKSVDLVLPAWVPGSYTLRPTARNVRELRATALRSETALSVERIEKARWRISAGEDDAIRIRYRVYGHDLITEALDVTPEHLFLNAALCLPYVDGHKDQPYDLTLHVPAGWHIVTELRELERHPATFRATDYDELVDSPVDCGTPVVLTITPRGIPHRIVLCGAGGNYEAHRLEDDLGKIVEATAKLFGGLPLERYTFFYHLTERRDGGLEHKTSTSIVVPRTVFRPESDYQGFLSVSCHEYFHLFNVKRIRPKVLGPFDYTKENYTKLLWAMEGTTDYYAPLLLRRAGLKTPAKYLEKIAKDIRRYLDIPGRLVTSLETASLATWIDLYQPFEDTVNQSVSYYLKGGLVSLCLDLEIREATENRSSLDTVFRTLWGEFGAKDRGLEEEELLAVMNRSTGLDLTGFFRRFVSGTEEIDFASFARKAGLDFGPKAKPVEPGDDAEAGYLGVDFENANGLARVKNVRDGSPARRAGLSPGDEIVAFDGSRVTFDQFTNALRRYPAGSDVDVALFRRGWLTHASVTTGTGLPEKFRFEPLADATPLARRIYESWIESPWEAPKPKSAPPAD